MNTLPLNNINLIFIDPNIEDEYAKNSINRDIKFFRTICAIAFAIHLIYIFKDYYFTLYAATSVRYLGEIPLYIVAYSLTLILDFRKYIGPFYVLVDITVLLTVFLQLVIVYNNPTIATQMSNAFPVIIYGVFIFSGLLFKHLLHYVGIIVLVVPIVSMYNFTSYSYNEYVDTTIILIVNFIIAFLAKYHLEKAFRISFWESHQLIKQENFSKKINEELIQKTQLYESLVENSSDFISMLDKEGKVIYRSHSISTFLGGTPQKFVGTNSFDIVHPEDIEMVKEKIYKPAIMGQSVLGDYRLQNSRGVVKWVQGRTMPILDQNNQLSKILVYSRDISIRKEWEDKIIEANDKLVELDKQRNRFFSVISHDLVGSVGMMASMLRYTKLEFNTFSEEELKEFVEGMEETANKTYQFLQRLLAWAKTQITTTEIQKTDFNGKVLIEEAFDECITILENKKLRKNIIGEDNIIIHADRNMVLAIIRNLIVNAIKFSHENSSIDISISENNDFSFLNVTDHGVGIEEDQLKEIWEVDKIISTSGTYNESGTGIGLLLCKEMAERNKGSLEIKSEVGKGTSITLKLPKT